MSDANALAEKMDAPDTDTDTDADTDTSADTDADTNSGGNPEAESRVDEILHPLVDEMHRQDEKNPPGADTWPTPDPDNDPVFGPGAAGSDN